MVMPFDRNEFSNIRFFKFSRNNSFQIKLKSREQLIVSVKATIVIKYQVLIWHKNQSKLSAAFKMPNDTIQYKSSIINFMNTQSSSIDYYNLVEGWSLNSS